MQRHTQWLQQRTNIQTHILRQLITPLGRVIDPLLQRPLEMRKALPTTPKPHLLANIIPPLLTPRALLARNADFECDFVTDLEIRYGGADGGDDAGGLMAEGQGLADEDVAVAVVGVVVQVAAAEAGGGDADLELFRGGWGEVAGFLGSGVLVNAVVERW
jgi:hypothetical protein